MSAPPLDLLQDRGQAAYAGEPITQLAHALQAAQLARAAGADDALVLAALLHDVGHLLDPGAGEAATAKGLDLRHEALGARYLARWLPAAVLGPIAQHVAAKRLLARDPSYRLALSAESTRSLAAQGGPFDDAQAAAFLARPGARAALALRSFDDAAKDPQRRVPGLDTYRGLFAALARVPGP